jgi:hypothetical protein
MFLFRRTTIRPVRNYSTKRIPGGMQFTCAHCQHSVTTLDFDVRNGNLRTQAATALNQHATKVHHEPVTVSSLDVQQRIWRT